MKRSDPFPRPQTPLVKSGTGPVEAALQRAAQRQQREEQLARIVISTDDTMIDPLAIATTSRATLPGDTRRLRGIPAIGYGVSGAIPGTSPHNRLSAA